MDRKQKRTSSGIATAKSPLGDVPQEAKVERLLLPWFLGLTNLVLVGLGIPVPGIAMIEILGPFGKDGIDIVYSLVLHRPLPLAGYAERLGDVFVGTDEYVAFDFHGASVLVVD